MPTKVSLNGVWLFKYDPNREGDQQGYYRPDFPRQDWCQVNIPAFWDDPRYDGLGWYFRTFRVTRAQLRNQLALKFAAVDDNADIYLNGQKVYTHHGANVDFYVVVSPYLKAEAENSLVVRIEDTGGAGGINGKVWLQSFQQESELLQGEYTGQPALPAPAWLDQAIIYEIFPRAFSPQGDLKSIQQALPYLQELGVNCLWLMPIFPIGKLDRKGSQGSPYATADYFTVNPELGTLKDLKELVKAAHACRMRIILDIACNHCAWDNRLLKEHPEYFSTDASGQIVSPNADWTDVADFDYANPAMRAYMRSVLEYWVRECDIDGYRLDVAELVPDDFWLEAWRRLQKVKPDVLMLAEGEHPRLHRAGFHLTYAWNVRRALLRIIKQQESAQLLFQTLERERYRYPQGARRMRFIENHDEARARQLFGDQPSRVAAVMAFTLPGVPMLYAGQELGETVQPSLFEKNCLHWSKPDSASLAFYKSLIKLRRTYPVLSTGAMTPVGNSQPQSLVTFCRQSTETNLLIVANLSQQKVNATLELPPDFTSSLTILAGAAKVEKSIPLTVSCQPWQWAIFKLIPH